MAKKKKEETKDQAPPAEVEASEGQEAKGDEEQAEAAEPSLEEALAASQEEARKNWDLYLRQRADLENYRRRAQRDKEDQVRFANENILREILPVMDNLERAVEHARQEEAESAALLEGVEMTLSQFQGVLDRFGVKAVEALGEPFDPAHHEAMGQVETAEHPANAVAMELQKGYFLNDRLLRPAMVMVAKAPEAPAADEEAGDAPAEDN